MRKVYEVERQLNNLYWQSEIYFGTKNEAEKYIKQKERELKKKAIESTFRVSAHEVSKLK